MFRKSTMLALAATVSLGAFALSSSTASAFHPVGGSGGLKFGGSSLKFGGSALKFGGGLHVSHAYNFYKPWPTFNHHWHGPRWWWWRYSWRRPYWIAPVVATGGVAAAGASYASTPAPTTNRCNCLTKDYTPQGAVVFKDVCTNEMAMNPPANASPAADTGPQMPQPPYQQGYLQPQAQ